MNKSMGKFRYVLFAMIVLFCVSSLQVQAQYRTRRAIPNLTRHDDRLIHFGFYVGVNFMDASFSQYGSVLDNPEYENVKGKYDPWPFNPKDSVFVDIYKPALGFSVGAVVNLRLHDHFDLRFLPGVSFGEKKIACTAPVILGETDTLEYAMVSSNLVTLPFLIKYKALRMGNVRPYVVGGVSLLYDLSKQKATSALFKVKPFNMSFDIGLGVDNYLNFFKLSCELRYSIGLLNTIDYSKTIDAEVESTTETIPYYSFPVRKMRSNMLSVIFYFE